MKHVVFLREGTNEVSTEVITAHRDYLDKLRTKGILYGSGPFQNIVGGLLIYNVDDLTAAEEIILNDPIIKSGCRTFEVYSWSTND
ncbi:YciI family protein [Alicyclobacillus dauci]|uniref:YciI family protein n=1 Tax=Alicyclobacillus dauci TaxID=1475485 RepID=A0ABY6ZB03_9BACL|nr:YciI family protein [Alicyclobacillus dauci]WAH36342.1 YciI family protein [Alicyclobacillus dauci]WAH39389.1 YciI family protein [Alicyclobacillus dauci]